MASVGRSSQERRCLAGFLMVLKHSLFLDTTETPHQDNEERRLINIRCDVHLH